MWVSTFQREEKRLYKLEYIDSYIQNELSEEEHEVV